MQMAIKVDVQWVVEYADPADALLPGHRREMPSVLRSRSPRPSQTPWESAASSLDPAFRMRCSKLVQFIG
jgi:hypothetical protein